MKIASTISTAARWDTPPTQVLVADLDHTLVCTDLLYETFWSAFAHDWRTPFVAACALIGGKADLKECLLARSDIDVSSLPYNEAVLERLRGWRARNGRTALVTGSSHAIAQRIATHVGLFDEVQGSQSGRNLKGSVKAEYLRETFGERGFVYIGDAHADIAVWEHAHQAITIGANETLRDAVDAKTGYREPPLHLLPRDSRDAKAYARVLRPHQWLKNLLLFVPMLAAHAVNGLTLLHSAAAFIAFSLLASSAYTLNDLLDLGADRAHPRKRYRPFASGAVRIDEGSLIAFGLLACGIVVGMTLAWAFLGVLALYFVVTIAYSLRLKRVVVIDICTLAFLYTLRVAAGGVATGIKVSVWLHGFSIFFFLSLAAMKRQAELVDAARSGRLTAHGRAYHVEDLMPIAIIAASAGYVSVLVLALYVNSPQVTAFYSSPPVLLGVCMVLLYWLSRLFIISHRGGMHDDPVVFAVKDRVSQGCGIVIVGIAALAMLL